ncbi:amino acid ABC transporter permease [Roseovarius arcticus]|uniref:amino acid ABC transporter permease n=1 Tax=Roseovarius arcticus TaxID=2547404 RepID=UPI00110FFE99|nr:amino acid ABC transporter permease [Roseovarius arcticus]
MFDTSLTASDLWFMMKGAGVTLAITFFAVTGGTLLGVTFGVIRSHVNPWLTLPLVFLLDIFRSVPLLIQLILANAFQAIAGLQISPFTTSCIVLALYTSAYCTEIVRGAIDAVPPVTRRAARSLGLTWGQDMTQIVFPMSLRVGLPSWIGLTLGVMKDSALVMWLGIIELLKSSQIIITRLQEPMLILLIAGAIYFALSFPIARLGGHLERKWQEND